MYVFLLWDLKTDYVVTLQNDGLFITEQFHIDHD